MILNRRTAMCKFDAFAHAVEALTPEQGIAPDDTDAVGLLQALSTRSLLQEDLESPAEN